MASNPASDTHQYALHSSTFIFHQFPVQSPNPLFSVLTEIGNTPRRVSGPFLRLGNTVLKTPKNRSQSCQRFLKPSSKNQSGYLTTVLKILEEPVQSMTTVLKNLIEEPVWIFDQGSQNPGRTGLDTRPRFSKPLELVQIHDHGSQAFWEWNRLMTPV